MYVNYNTLAAADDQRREAIQRHMIHAASLRRAGQPNRAERRRLAKLQRAER